MGLLSQWELTVEFVVYGADCDPDDITKALGIEPSRTWRKGEAPWRGGSPARDSGWMLKSALPKQAPLSDHLLSLLELLPPKLPVAASAAGSATAGIWIAVYGRDGFPAVTFEPEILRRIVALGAHIDVDIYSLPRASSP